VAAEAKLENNRASVIEGLGGRDQIGQRRGRRRFIAKY